MIETLKLRLEAGSQMEDLAGYILRDMPDDELDAVEVERVFKRAAQEHVGGLFLLKKAS
jgi:hypothetical protein